MELKLKMKIDDFLLIVRNLPYEDKLVIKKQLDKDLTPMVKDGDKTLQQLLLAGPLMSVNGYKNYKVLKNQFSKWTKKLSV